ncbi:homocysteine S-methyltransferase family protein [Alphaproteobacteria bacterium]|nr:homocysteine S-methyltransferase family protein [Alphaproteobacteria bacterium]
MKNKLILDGGMGQALLQRGMKPNGSLWSASALVDINQHSLIENLHLDFINSGCQAIISNNFTVRDRRLIDNNMQEKKKYLLDTAGKLASNAVKKSGKNILIGGSIPTQGETYMAQIFQSKNIIKKLFYETAHTLNPYSDFFYLDVLCSIDEIHLALESIKEFNKPVLIGAHFKKNGLLPSGENITKIKSIINQYNVMGVLGACISPEIYKKILPDLQSLKLPFGFKINAFKNIPDDWSVANNYNPNEVLGLRSDFTPDVFRYFVEREVKNGASFVGGCCETHPEHIEAIRNSL